MTHDDDWMSFLSLACIILLRSIRLWYDRKVVNNNGRMRIIPICCNVVLSLIMMVNCLSATAVELLWNHCRNFIAVGPGLFSALCL